MSSIVSQVIIWAASVRSKDNSVRNEEKLVSLLKDVMDDQYDPWAPTSALDVQAPTAPNISFEQSMQARRAELRAEELQAWIDTADLLDRYEAIAWLVGIILAERRRKKAMDLQESVAESAPPLPEDQAGETAVEHRQAVAVTLDPDIAALLPASERVNQVLQILIRAAREIDDLG